LLDRDRGTYIRTVSLVTAILQGKWKIQILCALRSEPVRLSRLTRLIPSASKKALRAGLRDLEIAEIIVRRDMSHAVLHVEYDFAEDMREILPSLLDNLSNLRPRFCSEPVAVRNSTHVENCCIAKRNSRHVSESH
jgi:DNA-binding HxlR family transcriptional regulator